MDIAALLRVVASDAGGRGVPLLSRVHHWKKALSLCVGAKKIVIVTGFFIAGVEAPETDGPLGSVILGRALMRLGREVLLMTDSRNFSVLSACSKAVDGPATVVSDSGEEEFCRLGEPDLLIFLERPGRALDGHYYNMNGVDITSVVTPLDSLALAAVEGGRTVLGIGDGGNEVGMGFLYDDLVSLLPGYTSFLSCVPSTVCLTVDVSNWGGYALAALLSVHFDQWLGVDSEEEERMLETVARCGAVDGVLGRAALSVDGFSLSDLKQVVSQIQGWFVQETSNKMLRTPSEL